jgi:capsular polysaccharide biosynthesis protein
VSEKLQGQKIDVDLLAIDVGGVEREVLSARIRRIEFDRVDEDFVSRLRGTWLGRMYIGKFKRFFAVQWLVILMWRYGYLLYIKYISSLFAGRSRGKASRWRPLISLSEYVTKNNLSKYILARVDYVQVMKPQVFPASDQGYLGLSQDGYDYPEIFVTRISETVVYGGTNFVCVDASVICHDLYDFERDYTSEELHARALISPKAKFTRIRWLMYDKVPIPISVAATFVDACAQNYAHWMTEVLPRIVLFCGDERFKTVPIIVNNDLHQNILSSLLLVVGPDREIIALPIGRALAVSQLYVTSVTGYVPFGRRASKRLGHSHGVFSSWALDKLRSQFSTVGQAVSREVAPQKIFLLRSSGTRKLTNATQIEELLANDGYELVEPENLTFSQQIFLFSNAKVIISSTGAALANVIASKPGTNVVVLMSKHEDMIYRYWNNMLSPLGVRVTYVLGTIVANRSLGIHGDFFVDPNDITDLLENMANI